MHTWALWRNVESCITISIRLSCNVITLLKITHCSLGEDVMSIPCVRPEDCSGATLTG